MLDCSLTGAPSSPAKQAQLPAEAPAPTPDPKTPKPRPDPHSHSKPPAAPLQAHLARAPAQTPPPKPASSQPAVATSPADPPLSPKPSITRPPRLHQMRPSPMTQGPRLQPRPQIARLSRPPCFLKFLEAPMRLSPRQPGHSSFKPHARLINTSSRTSWMMGASAPPRSMPPAPQ